MALPACSDGDAEEHTVNAEIESQFFTPGLRIGKNIAHDNLIEHNKHHG
ncbi:hypothetical protein SDC9_187615 [bioreactor metagenome]|uniref:Uncharacterized protein n=1 Tax=bioreactor metagenome TaxID=1076179 RepID=A0A645HMN5_9ZZZZ